MNICGAVTGIDPSIRPMTGQNMTEEENSGSAGLTAFLKRMDLSKGSAH